MKQARAEREAAAGAEVGAVVKRYAESLSGALPPATVTLEKGQPSPMREWRKAAAASAKLRAFCAAKAEELGDTPAAVEFKDGALLFAAVEDYWLGRSVKGPAIKKEWEAGYEASKKVAAKDGAREKISLADHVKQMHQLGRGPEAPWRAVADFELLLPHLMQVYTYRAHRGLYDDTTFSRVWQVMFELPRKMEADGPESYQPYRDRLCKVRLGDACKVPYEFRDIVVRGAYLKKLVEAVETFEQRHAEAGLNGILDHFKPALKDELARAVVPEEYPVMASTRSPVWSSPYTVLVVGPKGAVLESDDPADTHKRTSKELLPARDDWSLDPETTDKLVAGLVDAITGLRDDGATTDYTTELYYHLDKRVPVALIGALSNAYKGAGLKLVDFVARRRFDGTNMIRRVPGQVVDEDARVPMDVKTPFGPWKCLPIASLADSNVIPDIVKHYVIAGPKGVVASAAGKVAVKASLGGDLKAIGRWVFETGKPTLIAVDGTLTNAQLHEVLSAVSFKCADEACMKPNLVSGLLLAVCNIPMPEPPIQDKKAGVK